MAGMQQGGGAELSGISANLIQHHTSQHFKQQMKLKKRQTIKPEETRFTDVSFGREIFKPETV